MSLCVEFGYAWKSTTRSECRYDDKVNRVITKIALVLQYYRERERQFLSLEIQIDYIECVFSGVASRRVASHMKWDWQVDSGIEKFRPDKVMQFKFSMRKHHSNNMSLLIAHRIWGGSFSIKLSEFRQTQALPKRHTKSQIERISRKSKFDKAVEPATNYQLQFAKPFFPLMDGSIDIK